MFVHEMSSDYYINTSNIIKLVFGLKSSNINPVFQVFIDLCLFRRWKNIRISYQASLKQYIVIAQNPKKKKKNVEFFLPMYFDVKIMPETINEFLKFIYITPLINLSKKINSHLAFYQKNS